MKITTEIIDNGRLFVNSEFMDLLRAHKLTSVSALWSVSSDPVKKVVKERGTEKLLLDGTEYFIKRCSLSSIKERVKSAFSLKFRYFDAMNEWNALLRFHELGLNTMTPVAAGSLPDGRTLVLTLGLRNYRRASEIFPELQDAAVKKDLIQKIAVLAGKMHANGIGHQDFYLVHMFVMNDSQDIYLIDLQRCILGKELARRWIIKDLGQLYFSARDHVSDDDISFFISEYNKCFSGKSPLEDKKLRDSILKKAGKIKAHTEKILKRRASRRQA